MVGRLSTVEIEARAETDIRINGHRECPPPDQVCDYWDDIFAAAYEAVKPFLGQFRQDRMYIPPLGLNGWNRPFLAETAHQGVMYILNPRQLVYGNTSDSVQSGAPYQ